MAVVHRSSLIWVACSVLLAAAAIDTGSVALAQKPSQAQINAMRQSCRSDYIAALREVALDPNPQIRESALGLLAGEKDGFAQKKLLEGLKDPSKALVPPEKALQLLSYDVHAESYEVARNIVKDPPSDVARREALRLLAADAKSAPMFEKLLRDKDEQREVRQISASALHALSPKKLEKTAREILLDDSDYDDILTMIKNPKNPYE